MPNSLRRMQERFELLPRLKLDTNCDPEPQAIDDAVVTGLVVHAHALAAAMTWGVGGGFPDAYAASQREDKAMSSDARVACQTLGRVNGALCDGLFTERCILTASAQCAASPPASACPADAITFLRSCVPWLRAIEAAQLLADKVHVAGHSILFASEPAKMKC